MSQKDIYNKLEPILSDYRKLIIKTPSEGYQTIHMDEFVDNLLT